MSRNEWVTHLLTACRIVRLAQRGKPVRSFAVSPGEQHRIPFAPATFLRLPAAGPAQCLGSHVANDAATLRRRQDGMAPLVQ
jgi:hypothetical protein